MTSRTEGSDDVVLVGRTVAVSNDNPNIGVAVGVCGVATNLEQLVHAAVKDRSSDGVVGLVHLTVWRLAVDRYVAEATEVNHRRVGTGR